MRPRFANRGSPTGRGAASIGRERFNEAPIRESGKWRGEGAS